MTSFVLREVMMAHLLPWGNSYSQIIRSGRNQVTGLYPLLPELQKQLAGIELGKPETVGRKLKPILKNSLIFGSDLTATPLADRIEAYFLEEIEGPGAVRNTLHKYLN